MTPGDARAADTDPGTPPAVISVDGTCPSEAGIDAAIIALIPRGVAALPDSARVNVVDLGETYRVEVKSDAVARARLFRDGTRDCEQRARFAAVFIVLTLLPPELAVAPPPPRVEAPPAPPPPRPPPPPPRPQRWRLEVSALLDGAPAVFNAASMLSLGGELRAGRRTGTVMITAGIGFEPRASFSIGGLDGRVARLPVDVGLRLQRVLGRVELAGELGLAAAPLRAEGLNTAMPMSGTRLDVGARGGATLRFGRPSTRLAPVLGLHVQIFPWPYEITASPAGGLGTTPVLWLGATAGLSIAP